MQDLQVNFKYEKAMDDQLLISIVLNKDNHLCIYGINHDYQYLFFNENYRVLIEKYYKINIKIGMNLMKEIKDSLDFNDVKKCIDVALSGNSKTVF